MHSIFFFRQRITLINFYFYFDIAISKFEYCVHLQFNKAGALHNITLLVI